jgi:hypothetical protein
LSEFNAEQGFDAPGQSQIGVGVQQDQCQ